MTASDDQDQALSFAAVIGRLLLGSTAAASEVVSAILAIADHAGLSDVNADVTYNQITLTHRTPDQSPRVWIETIGPRSFNYGRYTDAARLLDGYLTEKIPLAAAMAEAHRIATAAPRYPAWAARLAAGTAGVTTATIFGAPLIAAGFAFLANVFIDWIFGILGSRRWPAFFLQIFAGFVAAGAAAGVRLIDPTADGSQVVVAVIILVLSGMTSTGAVQDLLTGWYLTGAGRLIEAFVNTIGVIVGIRMGIGVLGAIGVETSVGPNVSFLGEPIWLMIVVASVVALAFGFYAQLPWRTLPAAAAMTCVGWTTYSILLNLQLGPVWAAGVAALMAGLMAPVLGGWLRIPAPALASIAVIPLFPGILLYRGLLAGLSDFASGAELLVLALATAMALAGGVVFGQYIATVLVEALAAFQKFSSTFVPHFMVPFRDSRQRDEQDPTITQPAVSPDAREPRIGSQR